MVRNIVVQRKRDLLPLLVQKRTNESMPIQVVGAVFATHGFREQASLHVLKPRKFSELALWVANSYPVVLLRMRLRSDDHTPCASTAPLNNGPKTRGGETLL
jgi:hypothetical protein